MSEIDNFERAVTPDKRQFRMNFIVWTNLLCWIALIASVASAFAPIEIWKEVILPNFRGFSLAFGALCAVNCVMHYLLYITRCFLEGEKRSIYLTGMIMFGIVTAGFASAILM